MGDTLIVYQFNHWVFCMADFDSDVSITPIKSFSSLRLVDMLSLSLNHVIV
jgi:hypothetical protein